MTLVRVEDFHGHITPPYQPTGRPLRLDGLLAKRHKVRLFSEGEDLVVFSHGLGTDQTAWKRVIGRLPPASPLWSSICLARTVAASGLQRRSLRLHRGLRR